MSDIAENAKNDLQPSRAISSIAMIAGHQQNGARMKRYRCKQHKEGCRSYVEGLVNELEDTQREPTQDDLRLVEEVLVRFYENKFRNHRRNVY